MFRRVFALLLICQVSLAAQQELAFEGAAGFGAFSKGGKGGKTIEKSPGSTTT